MGSGMAQGCSSVLFKIGNDRPEQRLQRRGLCRPGQGPSIAPSLNEITQNRARVGDGPGHGLCQWGGPWEGRRGRPPELFSPPSSERVLQPQEDKWPTKGAR